MIPHYVPLFSTSEVQTLFNTLRQTDCPHGEKKALETTLLLMKNIYLSEKFQNDSPSTAKFHIPVLSSVNISFSQYSVSVLFVFFSLKTSSRIRCFNTLLKSCFNIKTKVIRLKTKYT